MILLTHDQGTPEWQAARVGKITASRFSEARGRLKKTGDFDSYAHTYAMQIALERVGGKQLDESFETWAMKRGKELEPKARMRHQEVIGEIVEIAGFVATDDGRFGATADGFIGANGGAEYKCLISAARIGHVLVDDDLSDYMDQVQGGMWITGRAWWDFCVYCPALASVGMDLYRKRISRDPAYISAMIADLEEFDSLVLSKEESIRRNIKSKKVEQHF